MQYDSDRHKEAKKGLLDIMNKYMVKQVDVARATGKSPRHLTHMC